jgi:rSAM/selenodomain-associated transferase 2
MIGISIIIPCVNEAGNLSFLLPYLKFHSRDKNIEILVIDGHSEDGSALICAQEGILCINSPVRNRAYQMNLGVSHSSKAILYFVHADTIPPASFYEEIAEAIKNEYPMGCYRFKFNSPKWYLRINSYFTRFDRIWCRGGDQTLFIKRDLFEKLGRFDAEKQIMEEYYFMEKARLNYRFVIIPKDVLVSARKYEGNNYFRVQWANFIAFRMYRKGISSEEIKSRYYQILRYKSYLYTGN